MVTFGSKYNVNVVISSRGDVSDGQLKPIETIRNHFRYSFSGFLMRHGSIK